MLRLTRVLIMSRGNRGLGHRHLPLGWQILVEAKLATPYGHEACVSVMYYLVVLCQTMDEEVVR